MTHPRPRTQAQPLAALCTQCIARSSCLVPAVLGRTPERKRDEFLRSLAVRRYRAGAAVIRQGDNRTALPLVCRGLVVSSILTEAGQDLTHHVGGPGTLIGLTDWLLQQPRYSLSATALVETTVAVLQPDDLLKTVEAEPELVGLLLKQLGSQVRASEHRFAASLTRDADRRILHDLLNLARQLEHTDHGRCSLPAEVTPTRLAHLTGLARETVSRCLRKLARTGLIALDDRGIAIPCMRRVEHFLRGGPSR